MTNPISVSVIKVTGFTNQTIDVTIKDSLGLARDILPNYAAIVMPGSTLADSGQDALASETQARVYGDPFGNFTDTTASSVLRLKRGSNSPAGDLHITIILIECSDSSDSNGFTLKHAGELFVADGSSSVSSEAHTGVTSSSQCQAILGGIESDHSVNAYQKGGSLGRLYHDSSNINFERIQNWASVTASAYLIEWGSNVSVQLTDFDVNPMKSGGGLNESSDWESVTISSVSTSETFILGTFSQSGGAQPQQWPEAWAYVLGDGVTVPEETNTISIGTFEGANRCVGSIYSVSCPNWNVTHTIHEDGTVIIGTSTNVSITPPADSSSFLADREIGSRMSLFNHTCEAQYASQFENSQANFLPISNNEAIYSRQALSGTEDGGVAVVQIINFAGSPYGDPNDISSTLSSVVIQQDNGIVITSPSDSKVKKSQKTKVSVILKDSAGKTIVGVPITVRLGSNSSQVKSPDSSGLASFTVSSNYSGTIPVTITANSTTFEGPSIVFEEPPRNFYSVTFVNLAAAKEYSSVSPFTDAMKESREPNIGPRGASPFHDPLLLDQDSNGYQKTCSTGSDLNYVIQTHVNKSRDTGRYVFLYDNGDWSSALTDIKLSGAATEISHTPGRLEFEHSWDAQFFLTIAPTSEPMTDSNYIRNIRCLPVDLEFTYNPSTMMYREDFKESLENISNIRLMNWCAGNNNPLVTWSDRPLKTSYTVNLQKEHDAPWSGDWDRIGAPIEWVIQLANETNTDIWWSIPPFANDDFVTQLATIIKNELNSDLRWFVEYSNELWNFIFKQAAYVSDVLIPRYGLTPSGDAWSVAKATRFAEIFYLVDQVFDGQLHRRVPVLAGQSANTGVTSEILTADVSNATSMTLSGQAHEFAHYYATAPYAGGSVDASDSQTAFNEMEIDMRSRMAGEVVTNKNICDLYDVEMLGYEGGQHLVKGNTMTEAIATETNRLPEMRSFITEYMNLWHTNTNGAPMSYFVYVDTPGPPGAWGLAESLDDLNDLPGPKNYKYYGWNDWRLSLSEEEEEEAATTWVPSSSGSQTEEGDYFTFTYNNANDLIQSDLNSSSTGFVTPYLDVGGSNRLVFVAYVTDTNDIPLSSTNNISLTPQFSMDGENWCEAPNSSVTIAVPTLDNTVPESQIGYCDYTARYVRFRHNGTDTQGNKKIKITVYKQTFGRSSRKV